MPVKKPEASYAYLQELKSKYLGKIDELEVARKALFKLTPVAKLGEPRFEELRTKCLEITGEIELIDLELLRVKRSLGA